MESTIRPIEISDARGINLLRRVLVRVDLDVFEDNERAIHIYEKLGFEKEGLKKLASIRNGKYINEYTMGRIHPSYRNS